MSTVQYVLVCSVKVPGNLGRPTLTLGIKLQGVALSLLTLAPTLTQPHAPLQTDRTDQPPKNKTVFTLPRLCVPDAQTLPKAWGEGTVGHRHQAADDGNAAADLSPAEL